MHCVQECIPVGCVPFAAVAAGRGGRCIPICTGQGVSAQGGVCPGGVSGGRGVCQGVGVCLGGVYPGGGCLPGGVFPEGCLPHSPPVSRMTDACKNVMNSVSRRSARSDSSSTIDDNNGPIITGKNLCRVATLCSRQNFPCFFLCS